MVYKVENKTSQTKLPVLLDPAVLRAARRIYRIYADARGKKSTQRPIGVVVDPNTYRGHVIVNKKPILLPLECFVPLDQLEPEVH